MTKPIEWGRWYPADAAVEYLLSWFEERRRPGVDAEVITNESETPTVAIHFNAADGAGPQYGQVTFDLITGRVVGDPWITVRCFQYADDQPRFAAALEIAQERAKS